MNNSHRWIYLGLLLLVAVTSTAAGATGQGGLAYVAWSPLYPQPAYTKYEWILTVLSLPVPDSYYLWDLQNGFVGSTDAFYMGLQPHGSCPGGGNCPAALFSFFGEGATSTSPSCVSGADGGPGESCLIAYNWVVGRPYRFTATLTDSSPSTETWTGTVTGTEAHITTTIGSWTIPLLKA